MRNVAQNSGWGLFREKSNTVTETHDGIAGECEFDSSLTHEQKQAIVEYAKTAFSEIVDLDFLRSFDPKTAEWAMDHYKSNNNLCFRIEKWEQDAAKEDSPQREMLMQTSADNAVSAVERQQAKEDLAYLDQVEQTMLIGFTALELGLLRGVSAKRNASGALEVKVQWCLTVANGSCPASSALNVLADYVVAVGYKNLLEPNYWQTHGATMPENLSQQHAAPERLRETKRGKEIGAPWRKSDIDQRVKEEKKAKLKQQIREGRISEPTEEIPV